jgi:ABC-type sulfate/molybdate transport systems ATPase subunit
VLLLDEPTNDLDVDTLRALEEALLDFAGCAVVISHDRWFLDRIATHILAFEGDSQVVWFEGNYQDYEGPTRQGDLAIHRRGCAVAGHHSRHLHSVGDWHRLRGEDQPGCYAAGKRAHD